MMERIFGGKILTVPQKTRVIETTPYLKKLTRAEL
jgi:hypothetical protein